MDTYPPFHFERVVVVSRSELGSVSQVEANKGKKNLGFVADWRKNEVLNAFLENRGQTVRPGFSWVGLKKGEELSVHQHPVNSIICIASGEVQSIGEYEGLLKAGDVIAVPSGHRHGFIGAGEDGFFGISIQLEQRGLYEKIDDPLVRFCDQTEEDFNYQRIHSRDAEGNTNFGLSPDVVVEHAQQPLTPFQQLEKVNSEYILEFESNPLFAYLDAHAHSVHVRERFLDTIQVWSNYFQKMVMVRSAHVHANTSDPFSNLAIQHLREEFDHNTTLAVARGSKLQKVWDPVLEALCQWFVSQMAIRDNIDIVLMVHKVLENCGVVFFRMASGAFVDYKVFLDVHKEEDGKHTQMGDKILKTTINLLSVEQDEYKRLLGLLKETWGMVQALFVRMKELTESYTKIL